MTCYWAQFENRNGDMFRYDTRVYLQPIIKPSNTDDICIGAIIGKNPGSAQPADFNETTLQPVQLGNDKLLPNVKSILIQAHEKAEIEINNNHNKYIQVLNLFYLCDRNLREAIIRINNLPDPPKCRSENSKFDFILYSWGGSDNGIDDYKDRFVNNPLTDNHIWYDYRSHETEKSIPCKDDFVKHIQGLRHEFIVPYIAEILKKIICRNEYPYTTQEKWDIQLR